MILLAIVSSASIDINAIVVPTVNEEWISYNLNYLDILNSINLEIAMLFSGI